MNALALALLAILLTLAACTSPLNEAGARKAATDYYMAFDHEGDNPPVDVVVRSTTPTTREARPGWEVEISGRIVLPGLPEGYVSAMVLFVDEQSGAVTVIAAG